MSYIMLLTQVAVSVLIMMFIPFKIGIIICISMLLVINILFATSYNNLVIEELVNKKDYIPLDNASADYLIKNKIYFKLR